MNNQRKSNSSSREQQQIPHSIKDRIEIRLYILRNSRNVIGYRAFENYMLIYLSKQTLMLKMGAFADCFVLSIKLMTENEHLCLMKKDRNKKKTLCKSSCVKIWTQKKFCFLWPCCMKVKLGILMMNAILQKEMRSRCTTKCLSFYSFKIFIKLWMFVFIISLHQFKLSSPFDLFFFSPTSPQRKFTLAFFIH